jgi:hypothetical protein
LLERHGLKAGVDFFLAFVPCLSGRAWPGGYDLASQPLTRSTLSAVDCVAILLPRRRSLSTPATRQGVAIRMCSGWVLQVERVILM